MERYTRIVVYVIVERNGKLLMGIRKGAFGAGEWSMPAGHLEFGESLEQCAARELLEETGLVAERFEMVALRNQLPYTSALSGASDRHYLIFGLKALDPAGEPRLTEPDRCEGWHWVDPHQLPAPVFEPARLILECVRTGQVYIS